MVSQQGPFLYPSGPLSTVHSETKFTVIFQTSAFLTSLHWVNGTAVISLLLYISRG